MIRALYQLIRVLYEIRDLLRAILEDHTPLESENDAQN